MGSALGAAEIGEEVMKARFEITINGNFIGSLVARSATEAVEMAEDVFFHDIDRLGVNGPLVATAI